MTSPSRTRFDSVEEMLADARAEIARLTPLQAQSAVAQGAQLVDIRPAWQRQRDGEIPGSLVIERNHLEWRLHPTSEARIAQAETGRRWIVFCTEGYASSLAASSLVRLGLDATDILGGIVAWRATGLPVHQGVTPVEQFVPGES